MATLTIHNIPDDLLKKLEHSARENRRTVDQEAVLWLSRVEFPETLEPRSVEDRLRGFRDLTDRYPDVHMTDEQITRAKRKGRLGDETVESDPWLEIARQTRESMPGVYIEDEEELNRFKREGRL